MKNKVISIAAFGLAAVATSCNLEKIETEQMSSMLYPVTLSINAPGSKMSSSALENESRLNDICLYAFDEGGTVEYVKSFGAGQTELELKLSHGKKTVYAVANCGNVLDVADKASLESAVLQLGLNTKDNFVMTGSSPLEVKGASSAEIELKRCVSKIILNKITTEFTAPAYQSANFIIKDIYLANVSGSFQVSATDKVPSVLNPNGLSESLGGLVADPELNIRLNGNTSVPLNKIYFSAPDVGSHRTKLMIVAQLQNTTYYYPLTLPKLERNKVYTVTDFKITRPGADTPGEDVEIETCTVKITVREWDSGEEISQTI